MLIITGPFLKQKIMSANNQESPQSQQRISNSLRVAISMAALASLQTPNIGEESVIQSQPAAVASASPELTSLDETASMINSFPAEAPSAGASDMTLNPSLHINLNSTGELAHEQYVSPGDIPATAQEYMDNN